MCSSSLVGRALVRSPEVGSSNLSTFPFIILKCRLRIHLFIIVRHFIKYILFHRCTMLVSYQSVKIDSLFNTLNTRIH